MFRELRARTQDRRHDRARSSAFGTSWPTGLVIVVLLMGVLLFLSSDLA